MLGRWLVLSSPCVLLIAGLALALIPRASPVQAQESHLLTYSSVRNGQITYVNYSRYGAEVQRAEAAWETFGTVQNVAAVQLVPAPSPQIVRDRAGDRLEGDGSSARPCPRGW